MIYVACIKADLEECYCKFGLRVQECGYLFVPMTKAKINAVALLKYARRGLDAEKVLWLVDQELFYSEIGPIMGCSAGKVAILYAGLEIDVLLKEAIHEIGHLMGLLHCSESCVMQFSPSPQEAKGKPYALCKGCIDRLSSLQRLS